MVELSISHRTVYSYRRPVSLLPHRLMLRPRESRTLQVAEFALTCDPPAHIDWTQDVFGNSVAVAMFDGVAETLSIESRVVLLHSEHPWPVFPISASAITYPFTYSEDDERDLGALRRPHATDAAGRFAAWVGGFVASDATDTLSLLKDLNTGLLDWIGYEIRDDYGTQTPLQSLDRGRGSCRDVATMLVEAARVLGFGARAVSGYLWDPTRDHIGSVGPGSTHAWAEIYVPGAGWITFDPTNRAVGAAHLVPVAVARTIEQIAPVTGGFAGDPGDHLDMIVSVEVTGQPGT